MIGIDSNVLVRLLTKDDAAQAALAEDFVARRFAQDGPVFINLVVLAETVWVLETVHRMTRTEVAAAVAGILETDSLRLEDAEAVRDALPVFTKGAIGLTDIVIAKANRLRGCEATATFDRKAAKLDGFVLVR